MIYGCGIQCSLGHLTMPLHLLLYNFISDFKNFKNNKPNNNNNNNNSNNNNKKSNNKNKQLYIKYYKNILIYNISNN